MFQKHIEKDPIPPMTLLSEANHEHICLFYDEEENQSANNFAENENFKYFAASQNSVTLAANDLPSRQIVGLL